MTFNKVAAQEIRRIRQACKDLGADEEMTALVVAAHRYDRSLLDVMVAGGGDLLGYVRHRLAIWEAILTDSPDDPTALASHNDHERTEGHRLNAWAAPGSPVPCGNRPATARSCRTGPNGKGVKSR